jgi:hypothetical protein
VIETNREKAEEGGLLLGTRNKVAVGRTTLQKALGSATVSLPALFQQRTLKFMERYRINLISVSAMKTWVLPRWFPNDHKDALSVSANPRSVCDDFILRSYTLKMEAVCVPEVLVTTYQTTRCHNEPS